MQQLAKEEKKSGYYLKFIEMVIRLICSACLKRTPVQPLKLVSRIETIVETPKSCELLGYTFPDCAFKVLNSWKLPQIALFFTLILTSSYVN